MKNEVNNLIRPCNFTNIIRPHIKCSGLTEFKNDWEMKVSWKNGSSHKVKKWILYRLIGDKDVIIKPADRNYYKYNNSPHWEWVADSDNTTEYTFKDNEYTFKDKYFQDPAQEEVRRLISKSRVALYYRVELYVDTMSANSLPIFAFCNGDRITALSTRNQVFNNKFYKDKSVIWNSDKIDDAHGFPVRVVVDSSDTDFMYSPPRVKPRVVWATTNKGWVYCFDYWTGKKLGNKTTSANGPIYAVAYDPIHSMFCYVEPQDVNTNLLCGLKYNGSGISIAMQGKKIRGSDWGEESGYKKTIVGASCSVVGGSPIISVIFDTENIVRCKINYNNENGKFSITKTFLDRTKFGCASDVAKSQDNIFGIINGLNDEMWTNGHISLKWAESSIERNEKYLQQACYFKNGGATTTCYDAYKNVEKPDLEKYIRGSYTPPASASDEYEKYIKEATDILYLALNHPEQKYIPKYGIVYRDTETGFNSRQWPVWNVACRDAGRSQERCETQWPGFGPDSVGCMFGPWAIKGEGVNKRRNDGQNFKRYKHAIRAQAYYRRWADEGFPQKSENKDEFNKSLLASKGQFHDSYEYAAKFHCWTSDTIGFDIKKSSYSVLQDIGFIYGFGGAEKVSNANPPTNNSSIRGKLLPTENPPFNTKELSFPSEKPKWEEDSNNQNTRLSSAGIFYKPFTSACNSDVRYGWIGTAIYYDNAEEKKPISTIISDAELREYFEYSDTAQSDRYIRKPYLGHDDKRNYNPKDKEAGIYSKPPKTTRPVPSQFGIGVSLPSAGKLVDIMDSSSDYTIYQCNAIEDHVNILNCKHTSKGLELGCNINEYIETTSAHPHHVICDDANTVWVITPKSVERYYPSFYKGIKEITKLTTTYAFASGFARYKNIDYSSDIYSEQTFKDTSAVNNFIGKHSGNSYCTEFYLLSANQNCNTIQGTSLDTINEGDAYRKLIELTNGGKDVLSFTIPRFNAENGKASERDNKEEYNPQKTDAYQYTDSNEYNEDNLGIAAIRALGMVAVEDICRPELMECEGHIKVYEIKEHNKTSGCDNEGSVNIFSTSLYNTEPLITSGTDNKPIKNKITSDSVDYDNWRCHLSGHSYDDMQVWHRIVFDNLDGFILKNIEIMASGNMVGPPEQSETIERVSNGYSTNTLFFTNKENVIQTSGDKTWKYNSNLGGIEVFGKDIRIQTISHMNTNYLWTEPNVRGGNIDLGKAVQPNYGPQKEVWARLILSFDVYDIPNIDNIIDPPNFPTKESNILYVYERWSKPDFCGNGLGDLESVDNYWGECEN